MLHEEVVVEDDVLQILDGSVGLIEAVTTGTRKT